MTSHYKIDLENEKEEFIKVYSILKNDIFNELPKMKLASNAIDYIKELLNSPTITGGKMYRGLGFLYSFNTLSLSKNNNNNNNNNNNKSLETSQHEARIIGWCLEFISFFLITDDIMDNGLTRRGELCWYRNPSPFNPTEHKVGMLAINDSVLIESFLFFILKKYFKNKSYYVDLFELFHESIFYTATGQLLDTSSFHIKRGDFTHFTFENYSQICINKSSHFVFYLQIKIAILLTEIMDNNENQKDDTTCKEKEEEEKLIKNICFNLGIYGQAQDDYIDCFGDPKVIGKTGTDIQENKCSWLICKAITICNNDQLNQLKKHYGIDNENDVSIVKSIFKEINIPKHYENFENEQYNSILNEIQKLSIISLPKSEILLFLLRKLFKRSK
ncbi:hypothetical protein ACTFIW_010287 [Dictyostelium discoideum]